MSGHEEVKELVEVASAIRAAEAATTLANYLKWKRPELEESIASIRGLGAAIRNSIPELLRGGVNCVG